MLTSGWKLKTSVSTTDLCSMDDRQYSHCSTLKANADANWCTWSLSWTYVLLTSSHWLTIGVADGMVNTYESIPESHGKEHVAAIDKKEISQDFIDVQTQKGTCDCGLSHATCLANAYPPDKQLFDQRNVKSPLEKINVKQSSTCLFSIRWVWSCGQLKLHPLPVRYNLTGNCIWVQPTSTILPFIPPTTSILWTRICGRLTAIMACCVPLQCSPLPGCKGEPYRMCGYNLP